MTPQPFRNASGGLIARDREMRFRFNGRICAGYSGDTLAAALLANGIRVVGRSFKYHRPRGIFGLGVEEPNGLVQLETGARTEPNSKATEIELYDGLTATSQNCWPSVSFDVGALAGLFSPLMPAGFYYKTFKWPARFWLGYEYFIRRVAGMGEGPEEPDPDRYEHSHAHCDVLIVGAGPSGLGAALAAGRSGARVMLVDSDRLVGGSLLSRPENVAGSPGLDWARAVEAELRSMPEVRILLRATAFGYYDHNQVAVLERVADGQALSPGEPRQRLWHVNARQVVLATGAHERSLVFPNNDLPGVMLASAARGYINRFAVRPGEKAIIFTNNDSAYAAALDLVRGGVNVGAVVDARSMPPAQLAKAVEAENIESIPGSAVVEGYGRSRLRSVAVTKIDAMGRPQGPARRFECDLLCVSGGWSPTLHLHAQARGRPVFNPDIAAYVPGRSAQAERCAGAANGLFSLAECLRDGAQAGAAAAEAAGFAAKSDIGLALAEHPGPGSIGTQWRFGDIAPSRKKSFVDLQNDVTEADIELAVREGYRSVEHVKRYTTLGMGTDQGKTSNTPGFALIAAALGAEISTVGTTTYRPPFIPITLGALAGAEGGRHFAPNRRTPLHGEHVASGAVMIQSGSWLRPQCYLKAGEDIDAAFRRESSMVRRGVGIVDVSTLGKFELCGRDTVAFLERLYINRWSTLRVGRSRYGVMLREDGMVFDDGTTTRLAETRFFMTTTTANSALAAQRMAYCQKVHWPELDVRIVNVTDQWAAIALAGPASRRVLAAAIENIDVGAGGLPYMGMSEGTLNGAPARVFRISFSGELGFEIYVPADHGPALWERLLRAGAEFGIAPYGIDALNALRIEKGHVTGAEINGRTTADDLGLGRMARTEGDFIGRRSLQRPALNDAERWQLVGIVPANQVAALPSGAKVLDGARDRYIGELTSATWSPVLQKPIALGLVANGRARHGQRMIAFSPLTGEEVPIVITAPVLYDPTGEKVRD